MAGDREILREIWEGKLPVCFQLDPEEIDDIQAPEPLYLMVPRLSYFPLVVDKVRKNFVKFVYGELQENEMWLEHHGIALKWHYPIGVLFDLFKEDIQLPWNITVHFDKFPESEILHCKSREIVESHFMACLKEADTLKHKTQLVSNMQRKDHHQLWLGLQNDKFDQFWAVNRRLMEPGPEDGFKYIPFRFYNKDDSLTQKLVKPTKDNGEKKTLSDMLMELFPGREESERVRVITHGIEPPKDTPLQWMSEHLSYPDNFLHLVAVKS